MSHEEQRPTLTDLATASSAGLRCPNYHGDHFWTVRTIKHPNGYVLRRRECRMCKHRFTTTERVLSER